jgi:hypothetical protein
MNASTSTLAQVGTTGYLTAQAANIAAANQGPFEWQASDMVLVYASDGWGFFTISADQTSLTAFAIVTGVTTPTVVGDFAVFDSTGGNIGDSGYAPSDPAKTTVVMAGSAVVVGRIAHFIDTAGTVDDTAGTVTQAGSIAAGLSGTAGTLISFPGTAANGSLILAAVNAGGAFNTTISNGVMGQSTVYSLPDIGASTGGIVVSSGAIKMKSVAGAAAAGGAAAQSFTDAFCTSGSNVIGNWNTQANPAVVQKIVPGNGSFVVTSDVDAGVGTFNYIITK